MYLDTNDSIVDRQIICFIKKLVTNVSYNHYKKIKRYARKEIFQSNEMIEFLIDRKDFNFYHGESQGSLLSKNDKNEYLLDIVSDLEDIDKYILMNKYIIGLKDFEIAKNLNVSPQAVCKKRQRLLRNIRQRLSCD